MPDNGQVERINRTIKDATVKRYRYDSHDQLTQHLGDFVAAYNFGRRLKTLKGLTPYEFICKARQKEPALSPQIRTTNRRGQTPRRLERSECGRAAEAIDTERAGRSRR